MTDQPPTETQITEQCEHCAGTGELTRVEAVVDPGRQWRNVVECTDENAHETPSGFGHDYVWGLAGEVATARCGAETVIVAEDQTYPGAVAGPVSGQVMDMGVEGESK